MRIGKANIDFWLSKNLPKWAKDSFHSRPLIDACIHAHSGEKEKVCSDTANLLALCRLWRKHGKELASELQRVAASTHPTTSTKTKALARKWAERININTESPIMQHQNTLHISGRRWFQKTYGNTYHTASIYINGELVHKTPMEYGFGDMYLQTAVDWLKEHGHLPATAEYGTRYLRDESGYLFTYDVADVLKCDL